MALYQWRLAATVRDPVFGSDATVRGLDSGVSHRMQRWFGTPDAALGAIAYLGDAVFGLAGSSERWRARPWLVVLFGIDVIPLAASVRCWSWSRRPCWAVVLSVHRHFGDLTDPRLLGV
jgi:hypothetical protein